MDNEFLKLLDMIQIKDASKNAINADRLITDKEKEMVSMIGTQDYNESCNNIRILLKCRKMKTIPLLYRKVIFFITYDLYHKTRKKGVQKKVLKDVGLAHNTFSKWGMNPIVAYEMGFYKGEDISLYREGKKNNQLCYIFNALAEQVKHDTFVDVFGGLGKITASKYPTSKEYINDSDEVVANFLFMIVNKAEQLENKCRELINDIVLKDNFTSKDVTYARGLYKHFQDELKKYRKKHEEENIKDGFIKDLDIAVAFYYLHAFEFNGKPRLRGVDSDGLKEYIKGLSKIKSYGDRLKNVSISRKDFAEVIEMYNDESTLLYADPPYYATAQYNKKFTKEDHETLCRLLKEFKGKWILSCRDSFYNNTGSHSGREEYDIKREKMEWFLNQYKDVGKYVVRIPISGQLVELMITNFDFNSINGQAYIKPNQKNIKEFDFNVKAQYKIQEYNTYLKDWLQKFPTYIYK